jgi:light-regulated signal transduction histidine kinase (bacteriophytochrome)
MNEELNSLVEELNALNESLEDKVNIRTHELKIQNEHLSEYAFINSHLLRAPIARMLGLANLIKMDNKLANDVDVIESLVNSTKEVDDIVKKISDILHEGEKPTRSNIDNY